MMDADALIEAACVETGLEDFGGASWREGLLVLVSALNEEASLTDGGEQILGMRLGMLLANRLRVVDALDTHPDIRAEQVRGPLVIIGLPRTGTTALSNLIAADPQIRSIRLWESTAPVPPPEADGDEDDPRIESAQRGLDAMYEAFPVMRRLYAQTATGPTECQDLLGMEFRTAHFDGMARVPSYTAWVTDCDMDPAYAFHRSVLQLLQWHRPPNLWHLKTPVHMLALDSLRTVYPDAMFVWTHRDPAEVMGSVCSLIAYTRSWVSDRDDAEELGAQQVSLWAEALRRALAFRDRVGEGRFADVDFGTLRRDPVAAVAGVYEQLGLELGPGVRAIEAWATANSAESLGAHEFSLADYGLDAPSVGEQFGFYLDRFPAAR